MLHTDPVTDTPPEVPTKIYRRPDVDPDYDTEAFHWANLTSGSRATAFWILLAPYALANAAGWMSGWHRGTPPPDPPNWRTLTGRTAIRAAGLALTALFLIQTVTAAVVLPLAWLEQEGQIDIGPLTITFDWLSERLALTILITIVMLVFAWLVATVSTKSHFAEVASAGISSLLFEPSGLGMREAHEDGRDREVEAAPDTEDPAGAAITDARLWTVHPILHRLRRLHLGMGLLTLAATIYVVIGTFEIWWALAGLGVVGFIWAWITTHRPEEKWVWIVTGWTPALSWAAFLASVAAIWMTSPTEWNLDAVHAMTFGVAAILGVFVALSLFAGPLSVGALVLATFFGGVLGTTIGLLVDKALKTDVLIDHGVGWVAVAMLVMILWLGLVAAVLAFRGHPEAELGATTPLPDDLRTKILVIIRRVVLEARVLFYGAAAFGLGAFVYVMVTVYLHGQELVGSSAGFWDTFNAGLEPGALDQFPIWLINLGITVGLLGPGYFAVRSVVRGWRGGSKGEERRRQVGILWDLGSFWPRWYHPLAPPGYGPRAIQDLTAQLEAIGPEVILAAHSQGSLISAVTIARTGRPTRFITYGSQLGLLYPRMFPSTGIDDMVEEVSTLCPSWINLWRSTDYLGGHYVSRGHVDNRRVTSGSGHSGYEPTPEYRDAREDLRRSPPPPQASPSPG
ncbi:MAG TPA: hypothetical protein VFS66_13080 [Acidimicrobiia bacterium]|nr:hypothetical protein [Acidimicrobiia bacterium]